MKLEKFIRQLLRENEMVIIPGMGAFISEYQPAVIDDSRDEIQPPSAKLTFNPSIRNNDGLLVNFITHAIPCSHFEALQIIEKERDDILYHLDKGRKVKLEGLGTFSYNKENQVNFVADKNQNLLPDSFGLDKVSLSKEKQPVETAKENTPDVTPKESTSTTAPKTQGKEAPEVSRRQQEKQKKEQTQSEELGEIGKYIRQLLLKNNSVIFPGFGAFIAEYQGDNTNISFTPHIKNNDGLLVGHIAETLECYNFEALQKIVKERDNIWKHLRNGEKVEMKDLGIFSLNEQKQINFTPGQSQQTIETANIPSSKPENKEETPAASEKPEEIQHQEKEAGKKTETTTEKQPHSEKTTDSPAEEKDQPFVIRINNTAEKETKGGQDKKTTEEEKIPEEKPEKEKATVLSTPDEIPDKKNRKKSTGVWIALIILLLILTGIFLFLRKNENRKADLSTTQTNETQQTKVQPNITPEQEPDSLIKEVSTPANTAMQTADTAIQNSKEVPLPKENEIEKDCSAKYYLVSGSFRKKENAEKYIKSLEKKGKKAFYLGKYGSFYIVGIGAYQTQREAMDAKWDYLIEHMESGVWVLKK